jgi:hypothetical protein
VDDWGDERKEKTVSKSISDLAPEFQHIATHFSETLRLAEFPAEILETHRTQERQDTLYAQGRASYDEIMHLREIADLGGISTEDAETTVTWTRKTKHIEGLAVDVVVTKPNGSIPWPVCNNATDAALWLSLGEIGEKCGLVWGGRWEPIDKWGIGRDAPHFEMPPKV